MLDHHLEPLGMFTFPKIISFLNNLFQTLFEKFFSEIKIDKPWPSQFHPFHPTWRYHRQEGENLFSFASFNTNISRVVPHLEISWMLHNKILYLDIEKIESLTY